MYSEDKKYGALERACRKASSKMYCKFRPQFFGTMFDIIDRVLRDEWYE